MRGQVSAGRQVSLFSTLAVQAALEQRLLRDFTEETGIGVQPDFDPT
ncbi:Molybdate ABC transporter substrate-binding protein OS=Streptomyces antimycoticus OX=68175 GN=SANT12839_091230 PE=4 SV=1 [Streptomyces antimycoticus]